MSFMPQKYFATNASLVSRINRKPDLCHIRGNAFQLIQIESNHCAWIKWHSFMIVK